MAQKSDADRPDIAEVGNDDLKTKNMGPPSNFTCPECGGSLWELQNGKLLRYRCHVGHGYTAESLMAAQGERMEDALWTALRALEETAGMRRRMAERARKGGWDVMAKSYVEHAEHAETRAGILRSVLVDAQPEKISSGSTHATESKAYKAKDLDAGKAKAGQPVVRPPPGAVKPPDPGEVAFMTQVSAAAHLSGRSSAAASSRRGSEMAWEKA